MKRAGTHVKSISRDQTGVETLIWPRSSSMARLLPIQGTKVATDPLFGSTYTIKVMLPQECSTQEPSTLGANEKSVAHAKAFASAGLLTRCQARLQVFVKLLRLRGLESVSNRQHPHMCCQKESVQRRCASGEHNDKKSERNEKR